MITTVYNIIFLSAVTVVTAQSASCPHGWVLRGSSCYLFVTDSPEDWMTATSYCNILHAKLVEIETLAEDEFLRLHLFDKKLTGGYWIGFSDIVVEGEWIWTSTQEPPTYSDWYPGQPDDLKHHQDCGQLLGGSFGFHWDDEICTRTNNFICEKEFNGDIGIVG
ncbi:perlucin-like [Saccostrea echinata]|uniref:perlucin-like n=1 Tax=Saccostrea echinata TaxID=191078 RepID=UPI002A80CDD4|nr:perlucin-like [Saccostrea echinata]